MKQEWLDFLKEHNPELYRQAKSYIEKLQSELEEKKIIVERYQNLIACNGFFDEKQLSQPKYRKMLLFLDMCLKNSLDCFQSFRENL